MSTYLSRPVFEFPATWQGGPRRSLNYDRREREAGLGRVGADQEQQHLVESCSASLLLDGPAGCSAFEDFIAAARGARGGFWFPSWQRAFEIRSIVSGTTFDIADINLAPLFAELPQMHVEFTSPSGAKVRAQVNSVTDIGGGLERIVLTGSVGIAATWSAHRLLYGRLAGDTVQYSFPRPNLAEVDLQLIELPLEYATAETGTDPVTLFHFWVEYPSATQHWRYTSFPEDIVSDGNTFTAMPVDYRGITHDVRAGMEEVELVTQFDDSPLALFFPFTSSRPVQCEILEAQYATPDDATVIASGFVVKPQRNGREARGKLASFTDFLGSKIPTTVIGPRCPLQWGGPACKVTIASFAVTLDIKTITGNVIVLDGGGSGVYPAGRFASGWIVVGTGTDFEVRDILASADTGNDLQLTLNAPLVHAVVNDSLTAYYGCQRTRADCEDTFNNLANYGGCPSVPSQNLSVPALGISATNGNKK